jgi:hypothetical protein
MQLVVVETELSRLRPIIIALLVLVAVWLTEIYQ